MEQVLAGAFFWSLLSGFLPIVHAEVVAVTAALLVPSEAQIPLVAACVTGRMMARMCLYGLARWSPHRLPVLAQAAIARYETLGQRRRSVLVVFASAGLGLPPFYLVSLAAGALRQSAVSFVVAGAAGTLARFTVIVWGATRLTGS